jgi:Glucose dehydrogenase
MTYVSPSGRQYVVVAAGGHRELHARAGDFDKAGDYIVAFALPSPAGSRASSPSMVTAGHYEGHIVLDRTRLKATWDLTVTGSDATLSLETSGLRVTGQGKGRVSGDTLSLDVNWTLPARNCGGTLRLMGNAANHNTGIVGELSYVDGCSGREDKTGTFADVQEPKTRIRDCAVTNGAITDSCFPRLHPALAQLIVSAMGLRRTSIPRILTERLSVPVPTVAGAVYVAVQIPNVHAVPLMAPRVALMVNAAGVAVVTTLPN